MAYQKYIANGYVIAAGELGCGEEITKEEYDSLLLVFMRKPENKTGYVYRLRADTLEWELVELPPTPEPEEDIPDEEALEILLGGAAE